MKTAHTLAMAVMHTESAVFPLANEVMKFEILPPGQAATIIIPIATLGIGLKIQTTKKVKNGNAYKLGNKTNKYRFWSTKNTLKIIYL